MDLVRDLITPAELTGYARAALADLPINQPSLARFLPDQNVDGLQYAFSQGGGALRDVATFRAFDAETPLGRREGFSEVRGQLPPLGRKIRLSEYDQLTLRNATAEQRRLLLRDAERLVREIDARLEVARGDALVNGSVTIAENGVQATVDFGRLSSHNYASNTAPVLWSTTATATPIVDLMGWRDKYVATNGFNPGRIVTSTRVLNALLRTDDVRKSINPNATTMYVTVAQVNGLLQAFGLPAIETYDAQFSIGGVGTRVIPDDKLLFLPPANADLGATLWGTTLESQEAEYGLDGSPGIVVGAWKTRDPIGLWTHAAAIALPILGNPNLSLVADVL